VVGPQQRSASLSAKPPVGGQDAATYAAMTASRSVSKPGRVGLDILSAVPDRGGRSSHAFREISLVMSIILIVVVLVLLFGGGGFYGHRQGYYGGRGFGGILGLLGFCRKFSGWTCDAHECNGVYPANE
jgi:hypothetical protein